MASPFGEVSGAVEGRVAATPSAKKQRQIQLQPEPSKDVVTRGWRARVMGSATTPKGSSASLMSRRSVGPVRVTNARRASGATHPEPRGLRAPVGARRVGGRLKSAVTAAGCLTLLASARVSRAVVKPASGATSPTPSRDRSREPQAPEAMEPTTVGACVEGAIPLPDGRPRGVPIAARFKTSYGA